MVLRFSKELYYVTPIEVTDDEGIVSQEYKDELKVSFQGTVYPAQSKLLYEMFGMRIMKMLNVITLNKDVTFGDGVYINSSKANYKVISVSEYSDHNELVIEKL